MRQTAVIANLKMTYPFVPKSNKKISSGDYWVTKLSNKSYAVGVVIDVPPSDLKLTREIVIGLLDWNGNEIPKEVDLMNSKILKQGHAHIKTISEYSSGIIGNIDFTKSSIEPLILIGSYGANNPEWNLMKGYKIVGDYKKSDREKYGKASYWGYDYLNEIAENVFVLKNKDWL
ncbi:hypothetical protein [uncultured Dokdonia sp.]|uniref:hypothetical protein n=1 Tax=uncultured Dokdonia sp. TaxID=575653 RepID=UPI0026189B7C|nr:hypothetical protein [uncultured Dokdonia sp.]